MNHLLVPTYILPCGVQNTTDVILLTLDIKNEKMWKIHVYNNSWIDNKAAVIWLLNGSLV